MQSRRTLRISLQRRPVRTSASQMSRSPRSSRSKVSSRSQVRLVGQGPGDVVGEWPARVAPGAAEGRATMKLRSRPIRSACPLSMAARSTARGPLNSPGQLRPCWRWRLSCRAAGFARMASGARPCSRAVSLVGDEVEHVLSVSSVGSWPPPGPGLPGMRSSSAQPPSQSSIDRRLRGGCWSARSAMWSQSRSRSHRWETSVRSMWLLRFGSRTPKCSVSRKPASLVSSREK